MAYYGAQGAVDAFAAMPINRMHQLQGDQMRMALDAERRRLAAEPLFGQTWYDLAQQQPRLPQPPMPGQGSVPMTPPMMGPPGPAGLYPPPQATMLPRPSPLAGMMAPAGVPPGIPLPNPAMMQGTPLPEQPQLPQPLYRPLRPGVIGEGASRLPPLMSTRPTYLDTDESPPFAGKSAAQLPIDVDEQGNKRARELGPAAVQEVIGKNDPRASIGMPGTVPGASVVPPQMGQMGELEGGASLPLPPSGGMSRMPAGAGAGAGAGEAGQMAGAGQGGPIPRPSFLDSPSMMDFINAARRVGVKPEDLPGMVERANPVMAKEMLAAQAAERAAASAYQAELRSDALAANRKSREEIAREKQELAEKELEEKKRVNTARIKRWEREVELKSQKLKQYQTNPEAMKNPRYRTALAKYNQEMQNWRSTMMLISNPNIGDEDREALIETERAQRARIDRMEEQLDGITEAMSAGESIHETGQTAVGTTVRPLPKNGEVRDGMRYTGQSETKAEAADPTKWVPVQ